MNIYSVMTIGGVIGIMLNAWRVILNISRKYDTVTFKQAFLEYWKYDKFNFVTSILAYSTLLFLSSEWVNLSYLEDSHPGEQDRNFHFKIADFIKTTSVAAGFLSDFIVYGLLGKLKKKMEARYEIEEPNKKP
jgi:hypothetical protein